MAFNDLPEAQREVLVSRELEGLSYDTISSRTGLSRSAVESMLFLLPCHRVSQRDLNGRHLVLGGLGVTVTVRAGQLVEENAHGVEGGVQLAGLLLLAHPDRQHGRAQSERKHGSCDHHGFEP